MGIFGKKFSGLSEADSAQADYNIRKAREARSTALEVDVASRKNKPLKLGQLVEKLQELLKENPDAAGLPVASEGCDCDGDVAGVELNRGYRIYLTREAHD